MDLEEKVAGWRISGALQLSRKYRSIGIPPVLELGETYLDRLRKTDPIMWERYEDWAREQITRQDVSSHIELTPDEMREWLKQRGCYVPDLKNQ